MRTRAELRRMRRDREESPEPGSELCALAWLSALPVLIALALLVMLLIGYVDGVHMFEDLFAK